MKGRTSNGRLRALDAYVLERESSLLTGGAEATFIDVGFGEEPKTTLESAEAFRAVNPALTVIGIESDLDRALKAKGFEDKQTRFVHGDLGLLPLLPRARIIRLMNVMRAHQEADVPAVHATLGRAVVEGGLVLEGTCDPTGDILTSHLLRRTGDAVVREGLLMHTGFGSGFAPVLFRDWLPRDLRRRVKPGEWIYEFFGRWTSAWEAVRREDARASFIASVEELARRGEAVDASLASRGDVIVRGA